MGYQNIHGLHDAVGCKASRLESQLKNDIEMLSEIWGCECKLSFDDYLIEKVEPQKHPGVNKGRKSGGFLILIRKNLKNKYKITKKSNNFVWIEFSKNLIQNIEGNFYIVTAYVLYLTCYYMFCIILYYTYYIYGSVKRGKGLL